MIVVSDTSCVSNLLTVGCIELLPRLFGKVFIPPAVELELRRFHSTLPGFIETQTPKDAAQVSRLLTELDRGEAEAISLACEMRADRIDESVGRAVALRVGVAIIGIIGVLVLAKHKGLLPSVSEVLTKLEADAGFYLGDAVKAAALREIGEV